MRVSQESTSMVTHWVMIIWFFSVIWFCADILSPLCVSGHALMNYSGSDGNKVFICYIYKYTHKIKKELRQVQFNLSPIFGPPFLGICFYHTEIQNSISTTH